MAIFLFKKNSFLLSPHLYQGDLDFIKTTKASPQILRRGSFFASSVQISLSFIPIKQVGPELVQQEPRSFKANFF